MYSDLLEALKNSSVVGVYIYQDEGKIVFANDAFLSFVGYSKDELLGKRVEDLVGSSPDKEIARENIKRRLNGEVFSFEYKEVDYITKDGYTKPSLNFAYTIKYNKSPAGLVICIDIHKQKMYERLYKSLSEINQAIVRIDSENKLLHSICKILVDMVGFKLVVVGNFNKDYEFDIYHYYGEKEYVEYFKGVKHLIADAQKKGKGTIGRAYRSLEITISNDVFEDPNMEEYREHFRKVGVRSVCSIPILKDKALAYILVIYSSIPYQFSDEYRHILEELQVDVSFALSRLQKEKELKVLDEAFDKSFSWVILTDENGTIVRVNRSVSRISGYTEDELIGKNPRIFKSGYHDKDFYRRFWDNIKAGRVERYRIIDRAKNGSLFLLDAVIVPVFADKKLFRIVNIARDITKEVRQKKRIERLSLLYKTLSDINRMILDSTDEKGVIYGVVDKVFEDMHCELSFYVQMQGDTFLLHNIKMARKEYLDYISALRELPMDFVVKIPFFKAYKTGRSFVDNSMPEKGIPGKLGKMIEKYGFKSCCAIPIQDEKGTKGVVISVFSEANIFDKALYGLLEEIKRNVKYALERIEASKWLKIMSETINTGFDFVVITDAKFNIVYVNENTLKASGYTREELYGKHHSIFSAGTHKKSFSKSFYDTLLRGESFSGVMVYRTKDGRLIEELMNIVPFKSNGKIEYFIAVGKDLTNEKQLQKTLEKVLNYDKVTNLINRDLFIAKIREFIERAKIERSVGAIVVINPVEFSSINKAFGHAIGDKVLREIAERLKRSLREGDVIARLESDKFGVLLKNMRFEDDVVVVVHKIINELSKPYYHDVSKITVSFNAGVALYPRDAQEANELIHRAMIGLEDVRKKGRGVVGFYRLEFEREAKERMKLRSELKDALLKNEFMLFYQPYYDSRTNYLCGAEALIRWKKPERIVPPGEFIPFLEETGDIVKVEDWVRDTVFKSLKGWQKEGLRCVPISINISPSNFRRDEFIENLIYMADNVQIDPSLVNIEITERMFLEDIDRARHIMKTLSNYGFRFSIDDFGTGYSSLSYLAGLPVNFLKVDISFVHEMTKNEHTRAIVEVIIYLAKKLGLKSIAEGVETEEQLLLLRDMGCDYIQGYLFSKPISEEEFKVLLKRDKTS